MLTGIPAPKNFGSGNVKTLRPDISTMKVAYKFTPSSVAPEHRDWDALARWENRAKDWCKHNGIALAAHNYERIDELFPLVKPGDFILIEGGLERISRRCFKAAEILSRVSDLSVHVIALTQE